MSNWLNLPPLPFPIFSTLITLGTGMIIMMLFLRVILSWVGIDERYSIVLFMARITDPFLTPIRRIVPPLGMMDFSWIIVSYLLWILRQLLLQALPPGW